MGFIQVEHASRKSNQPQKIVSSGQENENLRISILNSEPGALFQFFAFPHHEPLGADFYTAGFF